LPFFVLSVLQKIIISQIAWTSIGQKVQSQNRKNEEKININIKKAKREEQYMKYSNVSKKRAE
jgi:hypothetical protein